jgi:cell shape-determining protein MreC
MAVKELSDGHSDGVRVGQSATDKVGFYGLATPVVQRGSSIQTTSNVAAYSSTTASALIGAFLVEVANTLNGLGIWKGTA